jgi:hypothetical protein
MDIERTPNRHSLEDSRLAISELEFLEKAGRHSLRHDFTGRRFSHKRRGVLTQQEDVQVNAACSGN